MKRREFTKLASLSAVAVSTTGFIQFNGETYEGKCETTTDILGPFCQPDSPTRSNLIIDQHYPLLICDNNYKLTNFISRLNDGHQLGCLYD